MADLPAGFQGDPAECKHHITKWIHSDVNIHNTHTHSQHTHTHISDITDLKIVNSFFQSSKRNCLVQLQIQTDTTLTQLNSMANFSKLYSDNLLIEMFK